MSGSSDFLALLARLAWKREGRSHKARFEDDFVYKFQPSTLEAMKGTPPKLIIHQSPASLGTTVWDSSIVLGKYFEKQTVFPPKYFQSKSVIELGCGCGLTGLVLHCLGAKRTVLTDLEDTIDVVRRNVKDNSTAPESDIQVFVQSWGEELPTNEKFDVIVGTDIMYIPEAIPALLTSLEQLATPNADIYFAYGRNRNGEDEFKKGISGKFTLEEVKREDLDELYQSDEITVIQLKRINNNNSSNTNEQTKRKRKRKQSKDEDKKDKILKTKNTEKKTKKMKKGTKEEASEKEQDEQEEANIKQQEKKQKKKKKKKKKTTKTSS